MELNEILAAMDRFDCQKVLQLLAEVVVEYQPSAESHDLVWQRQSAVAVDDRKVTSLKTRRIVRSTGPADTARP